MLNAPWYSDSPGMKTNWWLWCGKKEVAHIEYTLLHMVGYRLQCLHYILKKCWSAKEAMCSKISMHHFSRQRGMVSAFCICCCLTDWVGWFNMLTWVDITMHSGCCSANADSMQNTVDAWCGVYIGYKNHPLDSASLIIIRWHCLKMCLPVWSALE